MSVGPAPPAAPAPRLDFSPDQWELARSVARQPGLAAWYGSTALALAYVACGRFDGYWAFDNWAWDVAAGFVLVTEAGGTATATLRW